MILFTVCANFFELFFETPMLPLRLAFHPVRAPPKHYSSNTQQPRLSHVPVHNSSRSEPPADLEERIFARIEWARVEDQVGQRRRRRVRQALLTSAAALLVVVAGLALYPRFFMPTVPIEPVAFSETAPGIEADASLIAHTRGTEIRLVASGLEDGQTYTVALLNEGGDRVPSGTFIGTSGRPVECNLNAALLRPDVSGLEVRGAGDELLLYAELPEQARGASAGGILSWISPSLWDSAGGRTRARGDPQSRGPFVGRGRGKAEGGLLRDRDRPRVEQHRGRR